jgi:hypothetical protein
MHTVPACPVSLLRRLRLLRAAPVLTLLVAVLSFLALPALHVLVHEREGRVLQSLRLARTAPAPAQAALPSLSSLHRAAHSHDGTTHSHGGPTQDDGRPPHGQGAAEHLGLALLSAPALPVPPAPAPASVLSAPLCTSVHDPALLRAAHLSRGPPA